MSVKIITDSTADMPDSQKKRTTIIPMQIRFGSEEYIDGVTMSRQEFYAKLLENQELPATSQPSPAAFADAFAKVVSEGDSAVVITISSKLSGTYQSACLAAEEYEGRVFVVDSECVALGTGALAERALQLVDAGMEAADMPPSWKPKSRSSMCWPCWIPWNTSSAAGAFRLLWRLRAGCFPSSRS